MTNMPNGYTVADFSAIEKAQTFKELYQIASTVVNRLGPPVGFVCGPISANGGTKSVERNMKIFTSHIELLENKKLKIFSQLPFEKSLWRILAAGENENVLLETLYLPLFNSGMLNVFYFIPGWESSFGANWEHKQALKLGIEIIYL